VKSASASAESTARANAEKIETLSKRYAKNKAPAITAPGL
jgi:hypothetical protein